MTAVVLATASAAVYGMADFFGGLASKRSPVYAVVAISQIAGVALLVALIPFLPGSFSPAALAWGALAGLAGGGGLVIFYRALASGVMSVVAPTTAIASAAIPVVYGLITGERPKPLALLGIALAILAVALISREPGGGGRVTLAPVLAALAAGAGFGGFFILLKVAPADAGLWPLLGARFSSIALVVTIALVTARSLRPGAGSLRVIASAGVLDMGANIFYLLAVQQGGLLSLIAVLASLYPASTLLLARYILGERLRLMQMGGVALALGAVGLIAAA
ncbi:DMT family transporter [Rhizohabitans arisaemae]|uniref:DMT family transporter n=1 Tax=Rhizohabitans arisaemae TaxID=2720610 RepID=UPI0024B1673E|nr:DMT family transporter [Rhizohabitans arisaemae]